MQYTPLVTIIIPVYNGSNFMREAIDAALEQTYSNLEILVINDGSSDDGESEKIALSYGNKITYYNKRNGGVSTALNFALEKMHGEWFSWLSHDDLYYPEKIEKQISFINLLMEKDPQLSLKKIAIHCATASIDKNGRIIRKPSYADLQIKENALDAIIGNVYNYRLSGCSFLLPYACYQELGGFREDLRTVSDVEYWYRLLLNGYQFYCMKNDILVKNRSHAKQVGKTKAKLFYHELNELHISIADQLAAIPEYNTTEVFNRLYFGLVKRKITDAAEYVENKYIGSKKIGFHLQKMKWLFLGTCRDILRYIYRRVNIR